MPLVFYSRVQRILLGVGYRRTLFKSYSQAASSDSLTRHEALTLLHKTTSLLPRALAHSGSPAETSQFWESILSESYDDLASPASRPIRITVYGLDRWSGAQDLVTAMLEEPLSSDDNLNRRIRERWKDNCKLTFLTSSSLPSTEPTSLHIPSSFFQQFPVPLQITEYVPASDSSSLVDDQSLEALLKADVAVIVCNSLTTPLTSLFHQPLLFRNSFTILVLTSSPATPWAEHLQSTVADIITKKGYRKPQIIFADPSRAVMATEILKSDSHSPAAIQRYQDDYIGSQVSAVNTALRLIISSGANTVSPPLQSQTTFGRLQAALSTCRVAIRRARNELENLSVDMHTLKARIEEAKVKAAAEVFGSSGFPDSSKSTKDDRAIAALENSKKEIKCVFDRLTWWRMTWQIDELKFIITQAIRQAWCRDLEHQLILETGRLSVLQEEMTKSVFKLLASHDTPPFNSAVLQNSLRQLSMSSSCTLEPHALTRPIHLRREQIIEHPTTRLHSAAQKSVIGMSSGIAAGACVSWAGWFGLLANSEYGYLGLDAGSAIGVGLLAATVGIRWAVGTWERSKQRWWEDWYRIGQGLNRDLRANLDVTMGSKILLVAESGCEKLSEMIAHRRVEIDGIEDELETLETILNSLGCRKANGSNVNQ